MKRIPPAAALVLLLAGAGCADRTASTPGTLPPGLAASQEHVQYGSGPVAYPTSIYDPSLLNDPSMLEDQPHNRGNKMLR
jgi:hypothetical protein